MKNTTNNSTATEYSWQERALQAEAKASQKQAQLEDAIKEMNYLKAQLRLLQAKRFGASSEKANKESKNQLKLFDDAFNEAEVTAEPLAQEPELITVPEHQRKKAREVLASKVCLRILSNTIFLKRKWFVRVAVMKDM